MSLATPLWSLAKARMIGKNYAVSTGYLPEAGTLCYQVPRDRYGNPVVKGFHTGWDENGPQAGDGDYDATIQATLSGTIRYSGLYPLWGNIVVMEFDDKRFAWGRRVAHMPRLEVKAGQRVARGQRIGGIGKGPAGQFVAHCHDDIWKEDLGRADRWNGGLIGPAALAWVKAHYVSPKAFYAAYGITNIVHEGGCPL